MTVLDWDEYPSFTEAEFACKCGCGAANMDPEFMAALQAARTACLFPFIVTSGYRCADYNARLGGAPHSKHVSGKAADIAVRTEGAGQRIIEAFTEDDAAACHPTDPDCGLGLYDRHVHLDIRPAGAGAHWTGKSK